MTGRPSGRLLINLSRRPHFLPALFCFQFLATIFHFLRLWLILIIPDLLKNPISTQKNQKNNNVLNVINNAQIFGSSHEWRERGTAWKVISRPVFWSSWSDENIKPLFPTAPPLGKRRFMSFLCSHRPSGYRIDLHRKRTFQTGRTSKEWSVRLIFCDSFYEAMLQFDHLDFKITKNDLISHWNIEIVGYHLNIWGNITFRKTFWIPHK